MEFLNKYKKKNDSLAKFVPLVFFLFLAFQLISGNKEFDIFASNKENDDSFY
jgi:hypothetical protein